MAMFNPCIVVPVYNHAHALTTTFGRLAALGLPCIAVDDGCDEQCRCALEALGQREPWIHIERQWPNSGKGRALKRAFAVAHDQGYSHALQVDADGQHDIADAGKLLAAAAANPAAMVTGCPVFDDSMPASRRYGRYLTHVWVWINTLSLELRDSMCGFRVYPIAATHELLTTQPCGDRMDFDTEVMVRWYWQGRPVVQIPTAVHYPVDGVSHFRLWRDNARISAMHTRLFFGMLRRIPTLLARRWR